MVPNPSVCNHPCAGKQEKMGYSSGFYASFFVSNFLLSHYSYLSVVSPFPTVSNLTLQLPMKSAILSLNSE